MSQELSTLLGIYFSTSGASLIMNTYLYSKNHRKIKKESLRNLKYKDGLCFKAKRELKLIDFEYVYDFLDGLANSLIPVKNVFFTVENINFSKEFDDISKSVYDEIVDNANKMEDDYRKNHVDMLRSIRNELTNVPIDLDDQETRLTKKETIKILKLNNLNYSIEMLKFEQDNKN